MTIRLSQPAQQAADGAPTLGYGSLSAATEDSPITRQPHRHNRWQRRSHHSR